MLARLRDWTMRHVRRESPLWRALRGGFVPVSWLLGAFYAALPNRYTAPGIVIGGASRSGTTLLLAILSAHPRIFAIDHETYAFCPSHLPDAEGRMRLSMRRLYTALALGKPPPTAHRWCEKTPRNVRAFRSILERLGDDVRLIHIVRDGRDVITSRHPRRPAAYYSSPREWVDDVTRGLAFAEDSRLVTVRYEDLVRDFEPTIARILDFLDERDGFPAERWFERATVRTHTAWAGGLQGIHGSSIERWRRPEHAARVQELLDYPGAVELIDRLGYPLV
jgi:hypothetical protein